MANIIKTADGQELQQNGEPVWRSDFVTAVKGVNLETRHLSIIGTTEDKDRDGDVVEVKGWELENYLKNPVFMWAHDHSGVPIGVASRIVRKKSPKPALLFDIRFPSEAGIYPFADMILNLYADGIIKGASVGFKAKQWVDMETEPNQMPQGIGQLLPLFGPRGRRFIRHELLELSGVAIPSNPEALSTALKSFNMISAWDDGKKDRFAQFLLKGEAPIEDSEKGKVMEIVKDCVAKGAEFVDEYAPKMVFVSGWGTNENGVSEEELGDEIDKDLLLKPYPNEHACRLTEPGQYDRIRRKNDAFGGGIHAIYGVKDNKAELQAIRFDKGKFSVSEAKAWLKEHDHKCIRFEPAVEESAAGEENVVSCDAGDAEEKGAIRYKKTPLASEGTEWDAGGEVRQAEVADLKVMCVWVDSGAPDLKTSYKGPHHKASGDHACVWDGVRALAAVVMGARGGMDIPAGDMAGVKAHVAGHYRDFDKGEPPWKKMEGEILEKLVTSGKLEQSDINLFGKMLAPDLAEFFDDPQDRIVKMGAVLNTKNKGLLQEAVENIQTVLTSAEKPEEGEKHPDPDYWDKMLEEDVKDDKQEGQTEPVAQEAPVTQEDQGASDAKDENGLTADEVAQLRDLIQWARETLNQNSN